MRRERLSILTPHQISAPYTRFEFSHTEGGEKLSLKTIAFLFPDRSVERALLHGRWRGTRGKGKSPTLLFGNHKDPRAAYESAKEMLGDYFDEIFQQEHSRRYFFWTRKMVRAVRNRVPVPELPLQGPYR